MCFSYTNYKPCSMVHVELQTSQIMVWNKDPRTPLHFNFLYYMFHLLGTTVTHTHTHTYIYIYIYTRELELKMQH